MEHGLELIIARLEIFGKFMCIIFSYPGNIGNRVFLIAWYPGNIGNWIFPISHILEMRAAGGRLQGLCCAALDYFWNMFPGISGYPGNIGNMFFLYFGIFSKKTRAEISRRMHRRMSRDLSYETDSGLKTKAVSDPNFQVTAAAASQQLSHLARALDHHAQGPNIPFGVNPSLRLK